MSQLTKEEIEKSESYYRLFKTIATLPVKLYLKPIVLNAENRKNESCMIIAPNHRQTIDPFAVSIYSNSNIHWAALKRFFDANDSIFNNNKNIFLCHLTASAFKKMGFIPVDRDDNMDFVRLANEYLKNGSCIGIFPEGTTNKTPDKCDLFPIKSGAFYLARKHDALIQPISILWIPNNLNIANQVIINYRKPFRSEYQNTDITQEKWREEILKGLNENKKLLEQLKEQAYNKKKTLVYKSN